MEKIVSFDSNLIDLGSAIDEVDVLVPKYLEAVQALSTADELDDMAARLQNVVVYWERLVRLFDQLRPHHDEIPFDEIMRDTLQSELATLEQAYLRVNIRIEFAENQWTKQLWQVARSLLERMDTVLAGLGFADGHEDRVLITEILERNRQKYQTWLLRYKLSS